MMRITHPSQAPPTAPSKPRTGRGLERAKKEARSRHETRPRAATAKAPCRDHWPEAGEGEDAPAPTNPRRPARDRLATGSRLLESGASPFSENCGVRVGDVVGADWADSSGVGLGGRNHSRPELGRVDRSARSGPIPGDHRLHLVGPGGARDDARAPRERGTEYSVPSRPYFGMVKVVCGVGTSSRNGRGQRLPPSKQTPSGRRSTEARRGTAKPPAPPPDPPPYMNSAPASSGS